MAFEPIELVGGIAIGTGVGQAVADVVTPKLQQFKNEQKAKYLYVPVSAGDAASIVAENVAEKSWGEQEATLTGISVERFDKLLGAALSAPGLPELLRMWRREQITDADFIHGLRKARYELRWDTPVSALKSERLDPAVIATAIQRGIMHDPGILPVPPPSGVGRAQAFPASALDTLKEAAASGINLERLFVETAIVG